MANISKKLLMQNLMGKKNAIAEIKNMGSGSHPNILVPKGSPNRKKWELLEHRMNDIKRNDETRARC